MLEVITGHVFKMASLGDHPFIHGGMYMSCMYHSTDVPENVVYIGIPPGNEVIFEGTLFSHLPGAATKPGLVRELLHPTSCMVFHCAFPACQVSFPHLRFVKLLEHHEISPVQFHQTPRISLVWFWFSFFDMDTPYERLTGTILQALLCDYALLARFFAQIRAAPWGGAGQSGRSSQFDVPSFHCHPMPYKRWW